MKLRILTLAAPAVILILSRASTAQTPLGTGFTYQALLKNNGIPVSPSANLQFTLWNDPAANAPANQVGGTITMVGVPVSNGFFTVQLNAANEFGPTAFTGDKRWLQILVNGAPLSPRLELTAAPYARFSSAPWATSGNDISNTNVGNVGIGTPSPAAKLDVAGTAQMTGFKLSTGAAAGRVLTSDANGAGTWMTPSGGVSTVTASPPLFSSGGTTPNISLGGGTLGIPNGGTGATNASAALTNLGGWSRAGNSGTTPGTNFLGTTDLQALEFKVNYQRALRLEPWIGTGIYSVSVIGGFSGNAVSSGVTGATISGGGTLNEPNLVANNFGTVGGGMNNTAGDSANVNSEGATVAGGGSNIASGLYSAVGGGGANTASGDRSTVPGGQGNTAAGARSFAAGNYASALHDGAYVWADNTGGYFTSTAPNQFLIRASGGVGIGTTSPGSKLTVYDPGDSPTQTDFTQSVASAGLNILTDFVNGSFTPGVFWSTSNNNSAKPKAGIYLKESTLGTEMHFGTSANFATGITNDAVIIDQTGAVGIGATPTQKLTVGGNICAAGTIGACSDARFKRNIEPLSGALEKVEELCGVRFDWKREQFPDRKFADTPQIGLVAQEVEKVVPEVVARGGDGYLSIDYGRLTPILVEAVKQLKSEKDAQLAEQQRAISAQRSAINELRTENIALQMRLEKLEALVSKAAK